MNLYELKRPATRNKRGLVTLYLSPNGRPARFWDVRAALSWPGKDRPLVYCLAGEIFFDSRIFNPGRGCLELLCEGECGELSLDEIFSQVLDAMFLYGGRIVYGDRKKNKNFYLSLLEYLDRHEIRGVSIVNPPYQDDFRLGMGIVEDWQMSGLLKISKEFQTYRDLETVPENLGSHPEAEWPRLAALAYLVSGFHRYEPLRYSLPDEPIAAGGDAWMAT